jgi:hypothetical protein
MSITQREWERQKDLGAQKARAYGREKALRLKPDFGAGSDARLREQAWLYGVDSVAGAKR